jgi:hypothetical protein
MAKTRYQSAGETPCDEVYCHAGTAGSERVLRLTSYLNTLWQFELLLTELSGLESRMTSNRDIFCAKIRPA